MSENGEIYTAGKNFTLPPAVTAVTSSTSGMSYIVPVNAVLRLSLIIIDYHLLEGPLAE